jgi:exodeoxyribonuclease V gamma subunit
MLMGYAIGEDDTARPLGGAPFAGIEPFEDVGGLEARVVGSLASLIRMLDEWLDTVTVPAVPTVWSSRFEHMLGQFFKADEDLDQHTIDALLDALRQWLADCDRGGFDKPIPLAVAAQAWMDALERPFLGQRFQAGGVTFCTLLPMRAIPFEVVCLLGMNDRDFPRRPAIDDFDLIAQSGQRRPGDRARRDDDRQLMLEALLSARRMLYVSWCGLSARDNSEQPPSVLVAQLRDYLSQGWSPEVLQSRTSTHPLQPFSRRYFEAGSNHFSYAKEWRRAHGSGTAAGSRASLDAASQSGPDAQPFALTPVRLARFLRNPVRSFYQDRLGVYFDERVRALPDDETFSLDALDRYGLMRDLAAETAREIEAIHPLLIEARTQIRHVIGTRLARLERSGRLPLGGPGQSVRSELIELLSPRIEAWCEVRRQYPVKLDRKTALFEQGGVRLEDRLDPRWAGPGGQAEGVIITLEPNLVGEGRKDAKTLRADQLIEIWVRALLMAASNVPDRIIAIGQTRSVLIEPIDRDEAQSVLASLIDCWIEGQRSPLPIAAKTALAFLEGDLREAADIYEGNEHVRGEVKDHYLKCAYPDFAALIADGRFERTAHAVFDPLLKWRSDCVSDLERVSYEGSSTGPQPTGVQPK